MLQVFISGCRCYHKKSQYIVVINVIIWIIIVYLGLSQCYQAWVTARIFVFSKVWVCFWYLIECMLAQEPAFGSFNLIAMFLKPGKPESLFWLAHINDYHNDKIYQKVLNCTFELLLAIDGSVLDLTWILDKLLLSCMCCWN